MRTMRRHWHLPRCRREMIGVASTGIAIAIRVRTISTRKDISQTVIKFLKQQGKFSWFWLSSSQSCSSTKSWADHPAGIASSRNQTPADEGPAGVGSSQSQTTTDRSPAGVGSSWNQTTTGEGPAGASSSWSRTTVDHPAGVSSRGDQTTADKHSGHGSSGSCTSKNGGSAGDVCLGDQTAVNRASGHGTSSSGKEGSFAVKFSWAGAGSESLTTANSQGGVGSQSYGNWQSWHNRQGIICEPDARYGWGQRYGRHGSNRHCTGGLHCNTPQAIWGHSPLSSLASHSHPYSSLLPRTVALERVQTEPWKLYQFSLQCQLMTENMAVPPVSVPVMTGLHNPSSMAVPSTGMDVLYGPSDLAAQMGTSNM